MKFYRINIPLLNIISIIIFFSFLIFAVYRFTSDNPVEALGDPLDLRGGEIIELRILNGSSLETISIYDDGYAIRAPIPFNRARDWTKRSKLNASEEQDTRNFIAQWCQKETGYSVPKPEENFYDVAVLCGSKVKQRKISVDGLPSVIASVIKETTRAN